MMFETRETVLKLPELPGPEAMIEPLQLEVLVQLPPLALVHVPLAPTAECSEQNKRNPHQMLRFDFLKVINIQTRGQKAQGLAGQVQSAWSSFANGLWRWCTGVC